MGVQHLLPCLLVLMMMFEQSLGAICIGGSSGKINDHHPSPTNGWSDFEQWNSSAIEALCPPKDGGSPRIDCADNKGEPLGSSKHTKEFTASCFIVNGLICKGNNQTNGHCPDFSVTYTCICPPTTTIATAPLGDGLKSTTSHMPSKGPATIATAPLGDGLKSTTSHKPSQGSEPQLKAPDNGAIGTGAIAGIAVGGVVLLSLVGAGVLLFFNISKKNRRNKVDEILNA